MTWDEHFNVVEDESGKYHYPVWWIEKAGTFELLDEGPFDSEEAAVERAEELSHA